MDYYELKSSKSKENLKEIIDTFMSIVSNLEFRSRIRYEILLKILIDKHIIDREEEILQLIEDNQFYYYKTPVEQRIESLPNYKDVNNGKLSQSHDRLEEYEEHIIDVWESEVDFMLNRLEELEKRTSFSEQKKNDE